jgi:N-acetylneuraminate synthase
MIKPFQLGRRTIGSEEPPFVIPEVGINHEGDVRKALQMVDAAAQAGAECVKFQCHITEAEMIPTDMKPGKISEERLWDIIKRCELTEAEERRVKAYCQEKGLIYLCTPFSREAADRLETLDVAGFKIGSGECNNLPLLRHIARKGRPIILSTGMNDLASVARSIRVIQEEKCPLMLMHCTSAYPTPYDQVRLQALKELQESFGLPVGLSDHSLGIYTCLGAVALGAVALEKHFTVTRSWPGPDVPISIEPSELLELIRGSRAVWEARGGKKDIRQIEQPVIEFAYACVVAVRPIRKGERLSLENVWVKRPGTGPIKAYDLDKVLGRTAARDIPENAQIAPTDLNPKE